jgi:hypothetical protein
VLADRAAANPDRTAKLVQVYTVAPSDYPPSPGAPYGAGHCNFTPASMTALVGLLDAWVREGAFPTADAIDEAFGADSGQDSFFRPGAWPAPEDVEEG